LDKRTLDIILPDKKAYIVEHTESIIKTSGGNLDLAIKNAYKIHASNPKLLSKVIELINQHDKQCS
jgi:hypothetical protein